MTETDSSGFSDETFLHPTEPQIVKYIPDIEKNPCGFYFEEYEICGGFCPNGQCVSEGLSCYCKV